MNFVFCQTVQCTVVHFDDKSRLVKIGIFLLIFDQKLDIIRFVRKIKLLTTGFLEIF